MCGWFSDDSNFTVYLSLKENKQWFSGGSCCGGLTCIENPGRTYSKDDCANRIMLIERWMRIRVIFMVGWLVAWMMTSGMKWKCADEWTVWAIECANATVTLARMELWYQLDLCGTISEMNKRIRIKHRSYDDNDDDVDRTVVNAERGVNHQFPVWCKIREAKENSKESRIKKWLVNVN